METITIQEVNAEQGVAHEMAVISELTEMQLLLVGGGSADVFCQ